MPSSGNDRSVAYRLVGIFDANDLWAHRADSLTFASFGTFRGNDGQDNAANAPWAATDPAKLVSTYFANEGVFSLTYTRNGYV